MDEAWCRRKVEWARRRSSRRRAGGFTSREEYSTDSSSPGLLLEGSLVSEMDCNKISILIVENPSKIHLLQLATTQALAHAE
jgi:hypothetical protein